MTFEIFDPDEASALRPRRRPAIVLVAALTALLLMAGGVAIWRGRDASIPVSTGTMAGAPDRTAPSLTGSTTGTAPVEEIVPETGTTEVMLGEPTTVSPTSKVPTSTASSSTSSTAATQPSPATTEPGSTTSTTAAPRVEDVTIDLRGAVTNQARPSGSLVFDTTVRNGSTAPVPLYLGGSHCLHADPAFEMSTVPTFDASNTVVDWDGNAETLAALLTPPVAATMAELDHAEIPLYLGSGMCGPMDQYRALDPGETSDHHVDQRLVMSPGPAPATVYARSRLIREGPYMHPAGGWLRTTVSSPVIELPYVDDPLRAKPFDAVVAAVVNDLTVADWVRRQPSSMRVQALFFDGTWAFRFAADLRDLPLCILVDPATLALTSGVPPWWQ